MFREVDTKNLQSTGSVELPGAVVPESNRNLTSAV